MDNFDEWGYLASNTDLIRAFGSDTTAAAEHYILHGYAESRSFDTFNASNYLSLNGDLRTAFGSDLNAAAKHYFESGSNEGRVFYKIKKVIKLHQNLSHNYSVKT